MRKTETASGKLLRWRRWLRRLPRVLLIGILLWLAGDFGYSRYVAWRIAGWEKSIQRTNDGVLAGCEDFAMGSGAEAVLLVHGINDSPAVWRRMAPELAAAGWHVRAMRLPGFAEPLAGYSAHSAEKWVEAVGCRGWPVEGEP
jgi:alpha-beta hydrolase superfamily lysophospholipase